MAPPHYTTATYRSRDSVGYLIRRLYTVLLGRFEAALAQADFTLTQWIVLIQLREGASRTASDLASDLGHDSGALTRVLDQLERRGFLRRQRSSRDRRVVQLELTPAGKAIAEDLLPLVVDQTNAAVAPLSKVEFKQLQGYLVRLLEHAQDTTPADAPAAPRRRQPGKAAGKPTRKVAAPQAMARPASKRSARRVTR